MSKITLEKLKEFELYHGSYDGFYLQKIKKGLNISTDEDWSLMESLLQDLKIVQRGLAAKTFEVELLKKLSNCCDSKVTIEQIEKLAKENW